MWITRGKLHNWKRVSMIDEHTNATVPFSRRINYFSRKHSSPLHNSQIYWKKHGKPKAARQLFLLQANIFRVPVNNARNPAPFAYSLVTQLFSFGIIVYQHLTRSAEITRIVAATIHSVEFQITAAWGTLARPTQLPDAHWKYFIENVSKVIRLETSGIKKFYALGVL